MIPACLSTEWLGPQGRKGAECRSAPSEQARGTGSRVDVEAFRCEMAASIACCGTDEKLSRGSGEPGAGQRVLEGRGQLGAEGDGRPDMVDVVIALLLSGADGRGSAGFGLRRRYPCGRQAFGRASGDNLNTLLRIQILTETQELSEQVA